MWATCPSVQWRPSVTTLLFQFAGQFAVQHFRVSPRDGKYGNMDIMAIIHVCNCASSAVQSYLL